MSRDLSVMFTSSSDEWNTPLDLFTSLNNEFNFNLDPCCNGSNNLCANYYTIEDNGLIQSWEGYNVFVNPPYSNISDWVKKCYYESFKPNTLIVLLIPVRTDTKYFHNYIYNKCEIRFIKGRLRFNNKGSAPFPSMLCIYNKHE